MYYKERNSDLKRLAETPSGTLGIDWKSIERNTGVKLHENVKDFFSRIICKDIDFLTTFHFEEFTQTSGNSAEYPHWLDDFSGICQTDIKPLYSMDNIGTEIKRRFETGGNSDRIFIGSFYLDIGDVALLINNDNGNIEWCDFGYGYFEVYEENPFAVISGDIQKFLDMLVAGEKTIHDFQKQNDISEQTP